MSETPKPKRKNARVEVSRLQLEVHDTEPEREYDGRRWWMPIDEHEAEIESLHARLSASEKVMAEMEKVIEAARNVDSAELKSGVMHRLRMTLRDYDAATGRL